MPPHDDGPEVLILGAGFSKAIHQSMPVANHLGQKAYALANRRWPDLGLRHDPEFGDQYPFETWLSLLAQDLPHLREADNRHNATTFARLRDAMAEVLEDAEEEALRSEPPDWLYLLITFLHYRQATVITFNYDTLIEAAVESTFLERKGFLPYAVNIGSGITPEFDMDLKRIHSWDILRDQPPAPALPLRQPHGAPDDTFRLLKLHGSLDWWQATPDPAGATLARSPVVSTFGYPIRLTPDERGQFLPGRERFIVPPLAVKSSYYSSPMIRQLWQNAYEALRGASRITLLGYSLPLTDIVTAGMMESAIRNRRDLIVEIVNPQAVEIAERVEALGGPKRSADHLILTAGDHAVQDFTDSACRRAQRITAEQIRTLAPPGDREGALIVTFASGIHAVTTAIGEIVRRNDHVLELVPEPSRLSNLAVADGQPTVRDLVKLAQDADALIVRVNDSLTLPILACDPQNFNHPNAHHPVLLRAGGRLRFPSS